MNYSPPVSSVHGDSPRKNTGRGCHALQMVTSKNQKISIAEAVEKLETWGTLGGKVDAATMENGMVIPQKIKSRMTT